MTETRTYTPKPGETGDAFVARLRATGHWQSGDGTLFRYSGSRITDAEITRQTPDDRGQAATPAPDSGTPDSE